MFSLVIPDHIDEMIMPNLYNWKRAKRIMNNSNSELLITNTTVETKLHAANFYLYLLSETSKHNSSESSFLKRTVFESMILNLNAAIESVAHVLNLIYEFNIPSLKVSVDHLYSKDRKRHKRCEKVCLRCRLKEIDPHLSNALDQNLKRDSPVNDWYEALRQYRHQILHRHHSIYLVGPGITILPDDPSVYKMTEKPKFDFKTNEPIIPNYTLKREITKYSRDFQTCFDSDRSNIFHHN